MRNQIPIKFHIQDYNKVMGVFFLANSWTHRTLWWTAALAAAGGLLLNVLSLGFKSWVAVTGSAEALTIDVGRLVGDVLVVLAWGVGFSALALIMLVRIGERREVVMAALFLGVYALWGGFADFTPFDGARWGPDSQRPRARAAAEKAA